MAVLWEEDGEIAGMKVKGRRTKVGNGVVKSSISLFTVGLGLGEFFQGEAGDFFFAFQEVLNVDILMMGFVAVLVDFLCGVF